MQIPSVSSPDNISDSTYIDKLLDTYIDIYIDMLTYISIPIDTHTPIHYCIYIHICIHTYIHTHTSNSVGEICDRNFICLIGRQHQWLFAFIWEARPDNEIREVARKNELYKCEILALLACESGASTCIHTCVYVCVCVCVCVCVWVCVYTYIYICIP